jgi:hypothetical protein
MAGFRVFERTGLYTFRQTPSGPTSRQRPPPEPLLDVDEELEELEDPLGLVLWPPEL